MKVKHLIQYLQTLNPENELLFADYYFEDREGFLSWPVNDNISQYIIKPKDSEYNKHYPDNTYLIDLNYKP